MSRKRGYKVFCSEELFSAHRLTFVWCTYASLKGERHIWSMRIYPRCQAFALISPSPFKTWICILGSIGTLPRSEFWKLLTCQVTRIGSVVWSSACAVRSTAHPVVGDQRGEGLLVWPELSWGSAPFLLGEVLRIGIMVGHVGNLPSACFLPLLTFEKCVGIQKWCMCPPGIHLFLLLTLCLTLQTSDFTVCFGRGYELQVGRRHQQKMNCKEWRAFQSCPKILVTRKLRKWDTKAELFKTEGCFCASMAARESVKNMEPRFVSCVCLFSPCL